MSANWPFAAMRTWAQETAPILRVAIEEDPPVAARVKKRLIAEFVRRYHPITTSNDGTNMRGALNFLIDQAVADLEHELRPWSESR